VEEEGIAAPTEEEPVITGFRHEGFLPDRDRRVLDDQFALLAHASRSCAPTTANERGLTPILGGLEPDAVSEIGSCIAVRVDLDLVQRPWGERLGRRRFR